MNQSDPSAAMKAQIRILGIARVAREAGVPATTLYSFCQNQDRQLAYKTAMRVQMALDYLSDGGSAGPLRQPDADEISITRVPIFVQDKGFAGQLTPRLRPQMDARLADMPFDDNWLRNLTSRGDETGFAVLLVSGGEMEDELRPGDHAMVDLNTRTVSVGEGGIFLLNANDRLIFAHCRRSLRGLTLVRETAKRVPALSRAELYSAEILGRVVQVIRTLPGVGRRVGLYASD